MFKSIDLQNLKNFKKQKSSRVDQVFFRTMLLFLGDFVNKSVRWWLCQFLPAPPRRPEPRKAIRPQRRLSLWPILGLLGCLTQLSKCQQNPQISANLVNGFLWFFLPFCAGKLTSSAGGSSAGSWWGDPTLDRVPQNEGEHPFGGAAGAGFSSCERTTHLAALNRLFSAARLGSPSLGPPSSSGAGKAALGSLEQNGTRCLETKEGSSYYHISSQTNDPLEILTFNPRVKF